MEYVIEETANGYSAFVPAFPGCVAAGETREETVSLLSEAISAHAAALAAEKNFSLVRRGATSSIAVLGAHQFSIPAQLDVCLREV